MENTKPTNNSSNRPTPWTTTPRCTFWVTAWVAIGSSIFWLLTFPNNGKTLTSNRSSHWQVRLFTVFFTLEWGVDGFCLIRTMGRITLDSSNGNWWVAHALVTIIPVTITTMTETMIMATTIMFIQVITDSIIRYIEGDFIMWLKIARGDGGTGWMMPSTKFMPDDPIITANNRSWTPSQLSELWKVVPGTETVAEIYENTYQVLDKDLMITPGVPVNCMYGTDVPTPLTFDFSAGWDKEWVVSLQWLSSSRHFGKTIITTTTMNTTTTQS